MYALETTTFHGRGTILDVPVSDFFQWSIAAGESSEIIHRFPNV